MKCQVCDNDTPLINSNVKLCNTCKQLNRSGLFSKILAVLLHIYTHNKEFNAVKDKCGQFDTIIKNYPLFITPFSTFDPEEHDADRVALHYLRNYVISEDNNMVQKHVSVKIDASNSDLYKTIAVLCRLDIKDGARELRVRNVIDMVLNAEVYHSADPELHSCLQWAETWKYFVLEQLHEKQRMNGPNAVLTLSLHSLSNIINMRIRSVYPKVPGGSDDLRKRLDRIFSPLNIQLDAITIPLISILWSNTKHISSHSTSSMWMPDCVVPLLPKPDCCTTNPSIPPRVNSAALQNPAERSFYILSCFCHITQSILNEIIAFSDQQKHSEAKLKKEDTKLQFHCPKCQKLCNDYNFDWNAVKLFRQNFNGARLTYILVDITSSMTSHLLHTITVDKKSSLPRIIQTKEAIKQLLEEISMEADPLDQAILTTFDDKLRNPALIPLCKATDIAEKSNIARIDAIELSSKRVETYFYSVLKEVYEMLEQQPFLYIDIYIFSDGIDTSPRKNEKQYQAIIRGLNEKIGAKCHFMNCGSTPEGFSVAAWLGDTEADCPISGGDDEIRAQIKASYRKDHARNPNLTSTTTRSQGEILNNPISTADIYMTDEEAASIRKPRSKVLAKDEAMPLNSPHQNSNSNQKNIDDYLAHLPSAAHARSATTTDIRSISLDEFKIVTRTVKTRKPN